MTPNDLEFQPQELVIVFSGHYKEAMEISLLLASQNTPHQIQVENDLYHIKVLDLLSPDTKQLIDTYHSENKDWLTELTQNTDLGIFISPLLFLLPVLIGYFYQFSKESLHLNITLLGRADSQLILNGEWWRTFTALTLHSGPQHFFSNMVSGFFLINLLVHRLSFGYSMLLVFLSSGVANYTVALITGPGHRSIGFSTAVFASLGVLAGVQLKENLKAKRFDKRSLIPLFGATMLVAFMGMGEGTDIRAHCFGAIWGVVSGFLFSEWNNKMKPLAVQWGFVGLIYGLLAMSWYLAL